MRIYLHSVNPLPLTPYPLCGCCACAFFGNSLLLCLTTHLTTSGNCSNQSSVSPTDTTLAALSGTRSHYNGNDRYITRYDCKNSRGYHSRRTLYSPFRTATHNLPTGTENRVLTTSSKQPEWSLLSITDPMEHTPCRKQKSSK